MIDIDEIKKQIQQTVVKTVEAELGGYDLHNLLEQHIVATVDEKVNATVTELLNRLITSETINQTVNAMMSADIQQKLDTAIRSHIAGTVAQVDVGTEVSNRIVDFVERRMKKSALPENFIPAEAINFENFELPAGKIGTGIIKDFSSMGIQDHATETNLTVMDGQVVIESELTTQNLTVIGTGSIKNLIVDSITVNHDIEIHGGKFAQDICNLIDNRIQRHHDKPIDLNGAALSSNQVMLIDNKSLGNTIVESNLRKLGRLIDLSVTGEADIAETLYITNGKIGVNTDEPAGALTIWDEEAEFTVRKYKNRNMYIGSTRDSELTLGIGGNGILEINRKGIATSTVQIGSITISTAQSEPSHRGSPGDIVINSKPVATQPWAWRCMGGQSWAGLS